MASRETAIEVSKTSLQCASFKWMLNTIHLATNICVHDSFHVKDTVNVCIRWRALTEPWHVWISTASVIYDSKKIFWNLYEIFQRYYGVCASKLKQFIQQSLQITEEEPMQSHATDKLHWNEIMLLNEMNKKRPCKKCSIPVGFVVFFSLQLVNACI